MSLHKRSLTPTNYSPTTKTYLAYCVERTLGALAVTEWKTGRKLKRAAASGAFRVSFLYALITNTEL